MGPFDEQPAGADAGRTAIESQSECNRFRNPTKIGIGKHDDGVAATQFHDAWREGASRTHQDLLPGFCRAGEHDQVDAVIDRPFCRPRGRLELNESSRWYAGSVETVDHRARRILCTDCRFELNLISRCQRLRCLDTAQEQRIVPSPDDQYGPVGHSMHHAAHAPQPGRTTRSTAVSWPQDSGAATAQKPKGRAERHQFRRDRFDGIDTLVARTVLAQSCRIIGDSPGH